MFKRQYPKYKVKTYEEVYSEVENIRNFYALLCNGLANEINFDIDIYEIAKKTLHI